ncbi:glutamate racemase [Bacilli bacterium PM5-3]|nr:glutamate racemase [Bacilli bacterium PM5-3]
MKQFIGVIDSGVGGLDILKYLSANIKDENFYFIADNKNVPYGMKSKEQLEEYGTNLAQYLEKKGAKMIIIACNTLSLNAIDKMREEVNIPIYGIARPTIKGFLNYDLKSVLVLATSATIKSNRYADFLNELDPSVKVFQQQAPKLVEYIEGNRLDLIDDAIKEYVDPYIDQIDAIILGCTHYPIVLDNFKKNYPELLLVDSRKQMVQLVNEKLDFHNIRDIENNSREIIVQATKSIDDLKKASEHFFDFDKVTFCEGGIE